MITAFWRRRPLRENSSRSNTGLVLALTSALLLSAPASSTWAAVTMKNTSAYAGGGRWDWKIFVDADPATLRQIKCVKYTLHPTFPNPVRQVCDSPRTNFALSSNGWGTFTIEAEVQYRNGRTETLQHRLVYEQETAPGLANVRLRNWSRELEPGWWDWGISLEGAPSELSQVRCVEYTLHPTFPNPVRMICTRDNNFLLTARGWGTFTLGAKLMLQDGSIRELKHQLKFQ